jgi:hypothetical protein
MAEEPPKPLGLERLSPDGLAVFSRFIQAEVEPGDRLFEAFSEELRGMPDRDLDKARTTITALARSRSRVQRELACHAIPYLAAKDPEAGFALWCELADSANLSAIVPVSEFKELNVNGRYAAKRGERPRTLAVH